MEDWQGCLSPACQAALQSARDHVLRRGGYAVTLEDFLLAMLDEIPALPRFLQQQGVDLDELTRTIQCEQPIVTAVASDNLLSPQLMVWISTARELHDGIWLDWPVLFHTLVHQTERLREKAYVAVLELVPCWPSHPNNVQEPVLSTSGAMAPVVIADDQWATLTDDVCVYLSARANALGWVTGPSGSGKSSWLASMMESLPGGAVAVDIRREADVLASAEAAVPESNARSTPPTLVLDNVSPADLMVLMASEFSLARELVTTFPGPVLMISADDASNGEAQDNLQRITGRRLQRFTLPPASTAQRRAILTVHQPLIEKRWQIEMAPDLIAFAAERSGVPADTPGQMLYWLESAAARLHLFAEKGPCEARALAGQADALRRQSLLALARQQPSADLESRIQALIIEQAAMEVAWHERKRQGSLRLLTVDDLYRELSFLRSLLLAASDPPSHYSPEHSQTREQELARP